MKRPLNDPRNSPPQVIKIYPSDDKRPSLPIVRDPRSRRHCYAIPSPCKPFISQLRCRIDETRHRPGRDRISKATLSALVADISTASSGAAIPLPLRVPRATLFRATFLRFHRRVWPEPRGFPVSSIASSNRASSRFRLLVHQRPRAPAASPRRSCTNLTRFEAIKRAFSAPFIP